MACASSQQSRSRRWRFSIRASRAESSSPTWATRHGTSRSPAIRAARSRRSPATSSYPSPARRTVRGCRMPQERMLAASSARPSSSKLRRGCWGLGRMRPRGMYWTRVDRNSPFRCNFMAFDLLSPILSAGGGKKGRTLSGNQNFPACAPGCNVCAVYVEPSHRSVENRNIS